MWTAAVAMVAALSASACGEPGVGPDPIDRLARVIPATARAVVAISPPRLRGTWLASSARAVRALVPSAHGCIVDVALASRRAMVAELAVGRLVVIVGRPSIECRALSQVEPGIWLATLDGAAAPGENEPRLADRPDFASLRTRLVAPIAAVAPDGDPGSGALFGAATIADPSHASLLFEFDSPERAAAAEAWLHDQLAAAARTLGDAGAVVEAITVRRDGVVVTATLAADSALAARDGPIVVVAAVAALAARSAIPPVTGPACVVSTLPVTCHDGLHFELPRSLRPTIEAALRAAHPTPRVDGGQPAGVRLGTVPADGVLAALGLRPGDAVIAVDGRHLDTRDAISEVVDKLRDADVFAVTIERVGGRHELRYVVK
jgi:hypothetical protein